MLVHTNEYVDISHCRYMWGYVILNTLLEVEIFNTNVNIVQTTNSIYSSLN